MKAAVVFQQKQCKLKNQSVRQIQKFLKIAIN